MVKKHIIDYANVAKRDSGKTEPFTLDAVQKVLGKLDSAKALNSLVPDHIAMGADYFYQTSSRIPRDPAVKPFQEFRGLRFYLDPNLPNDVCEFRNKKGDCISRMKWGA